MKKIKEFIKRANESQYKPQKPRKQQFVCYFWFVSFSAISFGISFNLWPIHIEIHLPFGFIRIGMIFQDNNIAINHEFIKWRGFGLMSSITKSKDKEEH